MENHRTLRLFVALAIPEETIRFLEQFQKSFKNSGFRASWSRMQNIHLTLRFIGDTRIEHLEPIVKAVQRTAAVFNSFELRVEGAGVFPSVKKARVLWAGVSSENKILCKIYQELEFHLKKAGVPRSKGQFVPHFTLARFRARPDFQQIITAMDNFENPRSKPFECRSMDLVKSVLKPSGAVHTLVSRSNFR